MEKGTSVYLDFLLIFLAKKRNHIYIKFLVKKAPANIIKFIASLSGFMFVLKC